MEFPPQMRSQFWFESAQNSHAVVLCTAWQLGCGCVTITVGPRDNYDGATRQLEIEYSVGFKHFWFRRDNYGYPTWQLGLSSMTIRARAQKCRMTIRAAFEPNPPTHQGHQAVRFLLVAPFWSLCAGNWEHDSASSLGGEMLIYTSPVWPGTIVWQTSGRSKTLRQRCPETASSAMAASSEVTASSVLPALLLLLLLLLMLLWLTLWLPL